MSVRSAAEVVLSLVRPAALLSLLLLVTAASAQAGSPAPQETPPPVDVERLPISVDRVREGLAREPALDLLPSTPLFRVEVIEVRPRWFDVEIDWTDGRAGLPTPARPAWHDQFLSMVTPPEARLYGAFTGTDLLQVMATSIVQGLATTAIAAGVKELVRDRRQEQAREEVDEAIARWRREREEAERYRAAEPESHEPIPPR